jgi:hypothetical protein
MKMVRRVLRAGDYSVEGHEESCRWEGNMRKGTGGHKAQPMGGRNASGYWLSLVRAY